MPAICATRVSRCQAPALLAKVVDKVDKLDMGDRDTKGDVYEYVLSKISSAGHRLVSLAINRASRYSLKDLSAPRSLSGWNRFDRGRNWCALNGPPGRLVQCHLDTQFGVDCSSR
jgi:hypothetical protein